MSMYKTKHFDNRILTLSKYINKPDKEYSDPHDFYQQFTELQTGTILYHFKGHQQPNDTEGVMLGDVITTDNCVTSHFGDTRLFFQHQYLEEDVELMPEWTDDYSQKCTSIC